MIGVLGNNFPFHHEFSESNVYFRHKSFFTTISTSLAIMLKFWDVFSGRSFLFLPNWIDTIFEKISNKSEGSSCSENSRYNIKSYKWRSLFLVEIFILSCYYVCGFFKSTKHFGMITFEKKQEHAMRFSNCEVSIR